MPPGSDHVPGSNYKWIALSNTTLGVLMATVNSSIVLIALPDIFRGIGINPLQPGNTTILLWMIMGYLVVTAVLVVSFGRLGDMFGRVRMYNAGFAVFAFFSIMLSVTWLHGTAAGWFLIAMRIFQGVGGAMLMANSSAILTDAISRITSGASPSDSTRWPASPGHSWAWSSAASSARSAGAGCSWSRCRSASWAPSGPTSSFARLACGGPRSSTGGAT